MGTDMTVAFGMVGIVVLLGGGDMAPLGGFVYGIGGGGEINKHTLAWPKHGHSPGAQQWWWWLHMLVVVVGGGGVVVLRGKIRQSQCVMLVMFQPWLLNLATCRCLLLINGDYY